MLEHVASLIGTLLSTPSSALESLPLEILPIAPEMNPNHDHTSLKRDEKIDHIRRELRICLSSVVHGLSREKRFAPFWRLVDPDEDPHYYELVHDPIDLNMISLKIDAGDYKTVKEFLLDIEKIQSNAVASDSRSVKGARGRDQVHNANYLLDSVRSHIYRLNEEAGHIFRSCERLAKELEDEKEENSADRKDISGLQQHVHASDLMQSVASTDIRTDACLSSHVEVCVTPCEQVLLNGEVELPIETMKNMGIDILKVNILFYAAVGF